MNAGFRRDRRSAKAIATFSAFEADLLRSLAAQLIELLRHESATVVEPADPLEALLSMDGPTSAPDDPVLARMFPDAYRTDPSAAGDFRRFTENSLRDAKARVAAAVIDTLEEAGLPDTPPDGLFIDVELDQAAALSWLKAFTDMRLAIGTRLEVEEGDEERWEALPDEDPRGPVYEIYGYLGFLQETLVAAL